MSYQLTAPCGFASSGLIDFQAADGANQNRITRFATTNDGDMPIGTATPYLGTLASGANGSLFSSLSGSLGWQDPTAGTYNPDTDLRLAYNTNEFINAGTPAFVSAYPTVTQAIPIGAFTIIKFDTIITDTASAFNSTTGVFTAPSSGIYLYYTNVQGVNNGQTFGIQTNVVVNGTFLARVQTSNDLFFEKISSVLLLNSGDTVTTQSAAIQVATTLTGLGSGGVPGLTRLFIYKLF